MNKRLYLIPACVSLALHGILFLNNERTGHHKGSISGGPRTILTESLPFEVEPETPPKPEDLGYEESPSPARQGVQLPGLDEFFRDTGTRDFVMETNHLRPSTSAENGMVVIGIQGDPKGLADSIGAAIGGAPKILSATELDNTPRTRYQPAPTYPTRAKMDGLTGSVEVSFVVNEFGEVRNVRVIASSDPIFVEETLKAVARWRFEPGRKEGRPVAFRMRQPLSFNLDERSL
jgi:protein TonB